MPARSFTPEQRQVLRERALAQHARARAAKAEFVEKVLAPDKVEPEIAKPLKLPAPEDDNFDEYDGLLSEAEKSEIEAEARQRARTDQKKKAKSAYAKEMLEKARREIGTMPADEEQKQWLEEPMRIYIDMPRLRKPTGGDHEPDPIILDQVVYSSGRFYEVPRAQAIYLLHLMDQARRHVNQVDGRSRTYYHSNTAQMIYQGGPAAGGGSLGMGFDAIHKRSA